MSSSSSSDTGLETCLRQQSVVTEIGNRALATGDVDALLADAVDAVVEVMAVDRCVMIEQLPDGGRGFLRADAGVDADRFDGDTVSLPEDSWLADVLAADGSTVHERSGTIPDFPGPPTDDEDAAGSAIAVAIGPPDDPWGVLAADASEREAFPESASPFLANVANVLAAAIETDSARNDLEEIYGRISDAFFALDEEWRFTYVNDRARRLISPDERSLVGENVWEAFPEAVGRKFRTEYERAMAEQETVAFEEYFPAPVDAWFEVRAYPSESGLSVYFRDVTERKEAQQRLAEERDMFAQGPAVVFRWRNEEGWPVEYVSENVEDAFGYAPEELESGEVPYTDLLHEDDVDRVASEVAAHSDDSTERFSHEPYRVRTRDGDVRWVTDSTKIIREDGEITGYLGYLVDVTERKEREEELRRYEAIVEAVDDGVYVVDERGQFTMVNEAYAELTGYDREELVGEHVSKVVDEEVLARAQQTEAAMRDDAVDGVKLQAELETASGDRFPAEASFAMLPTSDGDAERRIGVVRDVTERNERERELSRYERIVENLPVGVYRNTPGPDGEFVAGNERLASIFDADSLEEFMEHSVSEFYVDSEGRAEFSETLREEGMVENVELKQETLDGEIIWISITAIEVEEDGEVYFDGIVQDVTDRRERERELERYEKLLTETTDVNAIIGLDGTFQYLPPSVENVLGYDQEELLGEPTFERVHPEDRERVQADFQRMAEDPDYRPTNEFRYEHADGSWVWLESTGRNLLDDPAIEGLVAYTRDVTERKERERQLAERERQLSTLIDNVPGMVYRCRNARNWPMEFVSDGCLEVTGYDSDALERGDRSFGDDIVHEEDRERLWTEVQQGLDEDGSFLVTYRIVTPDGNVRWVRERGRGIYDGAGDLDVIGGVIIDITERKRLETELDEIFGRVTDAFYALDEEWRFIHANERAEELLGESEAELRGQRLWDHFPQAAETAHVRESFERAMETQEVQTYEAYSEHRDFWVDATIYPSETGVSVYFEDATDRIERERELERTERRFEAIFEDPNILVGLLDPDGTVLDINETAMEYIDADLVDVTGEPFWETPWWGEGDDVQDDVMEWTERAASGEYVDFETDLTRPDGDRYTLNGVFRPVTDEDGDVVSVIVSDRDVSERREYERQIEESERRYRTLAEYFPNGIVTLFDDELTYELAAGQAFEYLPVDAADLEGRHFSDAWDEETATILEPIFEGALDGEERSVEFTYADREWVVHAVPITDERGDVFAGMTMAQDITDRKERERELTKYETIVETINDGIYVKDAEGYFTMVNEAYAELTGYDREELLGAHASLVVDEETMAASTELRTEEGGTAGDPTMEAEIQRADGDTVPTEGTFASIETDDEREAIGVVRDVSERIEQRRRIEESERRYRTLVENFPNGAVGLFDQNLEYTAVGGEFLDQVDVPKEDRIGNSVYDIYPDELVAEVEGHFQAALEGEKNSFEAEFHDRHLFAHTLPVRNGDGEVFAGMLVVQDVTERRRAERDLRESEARFRMIAENLDEIVWMATPEAEEFLYVNPAFEDVWGIDRDELYDERFTFLDMVHPDDREHVEAEFTSLPDQRFDEEFRIVRPDGEVRWVHATGARVHDEDAEMVRIVGTGQDVTERVKRERRLEESERRYRTLAEHFPNGAVGVYDLDLRYTLAEGDMLGKHLPSAAALEGDRMSDVFPPGTAADLEPLFRAAVEDGETGSTTTTFAGRTWQVWATPLRDADGDVFAGLSLSQDITERVEREQELERALDLLERTQRIADVGGWEIDTATDDVFWTDHIFDLLEVDGDEEPPLEEALDMYHDEDQARLQAALDEAIESGEPFDAEVRLRTAASREERWLRLQGAPDIVDGEVVTLRGAVQDVTERKRREQRLEELVDKLEESNERLEQFAYAASHDLQEPLRMVSSYLQLIERRYGDVLDEEGEEFLEFAVDGADRMRDMIDGLLKYSRVDTRGDPFEPVDLETVLDDVREDLQVRIEESDAEITSEALPTVEADGGQIRQVFQNLLDNAIEYSGDDPPRVRVTADRRDEEWAISVSDEGIGIDPDDAEQVFEVFNSLHSSGDHSGTGIGLALCERIVERHGGDIWVDSGAGDGSTFTFTLADGEGDE